MFFNVHIFSPEHEIETLRHVISLEINIEEILASFVFRFEVSHVSEDISKKMVKNHAWIALLASSIFRLYLRVVFGG